MINQKVRGSRIENQHNYLYYVNLSPFLAQILKNLKNPEKVFQDFTQEKKTFPSELVLHLKNIQCDR